jgi:hypothetical protein
MRESVDYRFQSDAHCLERALWLALHERDGSLRPFARGRRGMARGLTFTQRWADWRESVEATAFPR